jgi:hypothetical protein
MRQTRTRDHERRIRRAEVPVHLAGLAALQLARALRGM